MVSRARRAAALVLAAGLLTGVSGPAGAVEGAPSPRVDTPYASARVYVNPEWSARAAAEPGGAAVAGEPTAVWLDRIAKIEGQNGAMGLRDHLDEALAQGADVVQLVLNDLPGRACDRDDPDNELLPYELPRYRAEFIDPIAGILADPAYAGLGQRPTAAPEPGIDAYVWAKPPGESDGSDIPLPMEGATFDRMCDPTYEGWVHNDYNPTGALAFAPLNREWFPAHFRELLRNAWPPLPAPGT
ncbi:glycoside hydrolase family 6 protein [Streptomyces litchfieldiae]|uniref:glycoside hydrolase family 6 protein n=1 Tax=Streptomyces litchfieldiae TaxID=3075543 RepID=UPI00374E14FF